MNRQLNRCISFSILFAALSFAGSGNVYALDAEDVALQGPCSTAVSFDSAIQLATFRFIRKDGFACAAKVIDALTENQDAVTKGLTVSLFWRLVGEARSAPDRNDWILPIITKIRMGPDKKLAAHARLASLRLRADSGDNSLTTQAMEALSALGFNETISDSDIRLQTDPEFKGAVNWAIKKLIVSLISIPVETDNDARRQRVADIGRFLATLSLNNPGTLRTAMSILLAGQQFIITNSTPSSSSTSNSMVFRGQVDVCASTECSRLPVETNGVFGQGVIQNRDQQPAKAIARLSYSLNTEALYTPTCATGNSENSDCTIIQKENGRMYMINGYGYIRGGSRYNDAVFGSIKGQADTSGHANYTFVGTVSIPACADLLVCDPTVDVWFDTEPYDGWASVNVELSAQNQSPVYLVAKQAFQLDRSKGAHDLKFEVVRKADSVSGEVGVNFSQVARLFVVRTTPLLKPALAKATSTGVRNEIYSVLPVISASSTLRLVPQGLIGGQPYYGLAQAFTQVSGIDFEGRWASTYLAYWYSNLISEVLVGHLSSVEQRELVFYRNALATKAVLNFQDPVQSQIKLMRSVLEIITPQHIDDAINAIQADQPLSNAISPLLNIYLKAGEIGLSEFDGEKRKLLHEALRNAAATDNLLEALSQLYAARHQVQLVRAKITDELDALIVEASILRSTP